MLLWEWNINQLPPHMPPLGIKLTIRVCALTANRTHNLSVLDDTSTNWAHWPGHVILHVLIAHHLTSKVLFKSFVLFFFFFFTVCLYWILEFFVYSGYKSFVRYFCEFFLSVCGLHIWYLLMTEVLKFWWNSFYQSFLLWQSNPVSAFSHMAKIFCLFFL